MKRIQDCKKIVIVGIPGSGKSFLSKILAERLKLPLFHMDELFLKIEDREQRKVALIQTMEEWTQSDKWIIDGNWPKHVTAVKTRLERADIVIHLDLPKNVCIESIKQRGKEQLWRQEDIDKMILIVETHEQNRENLIRPLLEKYAKNKVLEFTSRDAINNFIETLQITNYKLSTKKLDVDFYYEFLLAAHTETFFITFGIEINNDFFEREIERQRKIGTGVFLGGELIGLCDVEVRKRENLECGWVHFFYLAPKYRGCGLGKQLIAFAEDFCHQHGLNFLGLRTGENNTAARRLYEHSGFVRASEFDRTSQIGYIKSITFDV